MIRYEVSGRATVTLTSGQTENVNIDKEVVTADAAFRAAHAAVLQVVARNGGGTVDTITWFKPALVGKLDGDQPALIGDETPVETGAANGPTKLDPNLIRADGGTQARAGLDEATIEEYAAAMSDGATFPPIVVFYDGTDYWLGDGFHRLRAHKRARAMPGMPGRSDPIAAEVKAGTRRDAVLYAAGANSSHGLRRTNADKQRAVTTLLEDDEWSKWSDREIARRCGVSDRMVNKMRAACPSANNSQIERTVERNGQTYTMNTAAIGQGRPMPRIMQVEEDTPVKAEFVAPAAPEVTPVQQFGEAMGLQVDEYGYSQPTAETEDAAEIEFVVSQAKVDEIYETYSGDKIESGYIKKPFEYNGRFFVCTGAVTSGAGGTEYCHANQVIERDNYPGPLRTFVEAVREHYDKDVALSYQGIAVKSGQTEYVLLGPRIIFRRTPSPLTPPYPIPPCPVDGGELVNQGCSMDEHGRSRLDAACPRCGGLWAYFANAARPEYQLGRVLTRPERYPFPDVAIEIDAAADSRLALCVQAGLRRGDVVRAPFAHGGHLYAVPSAAYQDGRHEYQGWQMVAEGDFSGEEAGPYHGLPVMRTGQKYVLSGPRYLFKYDAPPDPIGVLEDALAALDQTTRAKLATWLGLAAEKYDPPAAAFLIAIVDLLQAEEA